MRKHLASVTAIGAIGVALLATPASSAPPAGLTAYASGSSAYAVQLDAPVLNDLELLASQTVAAVSSQPSATAGGGALVINGQILGGPDDTCPFVVPAPADAVVADIGCVTGTEEADVDPTATATSDEVVLELGGSEISAQVLAPLREAIIDQLGDQLDPVLDILDGLGLNLDDVLDDVLDSLTDVDGATVRVTLAPTNASASADGNGVLARSEAAGVIVEVLPALFGTPVDGITDCEDTFGLLCAQISGSVAQVSRAPFTGVATTDGTAAELLDFVVAPELGTLLADVPDQIAAAVNDAFDQLAAASPITCGTPGPLSDLICLDGAATDVLDAAEAAAFGFPFGEGTVGARASALRVGVLPVAQGGISLALNEAVAAANAALPAQVTTTTAPPAATPTTSPGLARTGGTGFSPALLLGMLGLAALGGLLVRRSAARA
jgi:hypothetical protein